MADTLQEYLVELKYKVDQISFQKMETGLSSMSSKISSFAKVSVVALAGAAIAVGKYAESMEKLGFVAARTKTNVDNLKAYQTAMASLGSTAESAQGSLERYASFLRRIPAAGQFIKEQIGVDIKGKDSTESLREIGAKLSKEPLYLALKYFEQLGIGEPDALALMSGKYDKNLSRFKKDEAGGHFQETADSAHDTSNIMRDLDLKADVLESKLAKPVMDTFNTADEKTGGVSSDIVGATVAIVGLGAAAEVAAKLWKAIAPAAAEAAPVAAEAAAGTAAGAGAAAAAGVAGGAARGFLARAAMGAALKVPEIYFFLHLPELNVGEDAEVAKMNAGDNKAAQMKGIDLKVIDRRSRTIKTLTVMGYTQSQISGIVAGFQAESGLNPSARGDFNKESGQYEAYGIGQWSSNPKNGNRQADYTRLFGHTMQSANDLDEQLKFADWELHHTKGNALKHMQTGSPWLDGNAFSRFYESPTDREGEAARRGASAQNINTTINVNGAGSPAAVGAEVARRQATILQLISAGAQR